MLVNKNKKKADFRSFVALFEGYYEYLERKKKKKIIYYFVPASFILTDT